MKKKLLAMLLMMVLIVNVMPLAALADSGYTPETCPGHKYADAADYSDYLYSHYCYICGLTEYHVDENQDCICDICGGDYHQTYIGYESDETGHWLTCAKCGISYNFEAHTDKSSVTYGYENGIICPVDWESSSDGVCDICHYGCQHTETALAVYEGAGGMVCQGRCQEYCVDCGEITRSSCIDENNDTICDICGYSIRHIDSNEDCICDICGNAFHIVRYYSNESEHWSVCVKCGEERSRSEHSDIWTYYDIDSDGILESIMGSDGICDICNYGCPHTNTYHDTVKNVYGYCSCGIYCSICGNLIELDPTDEDGDGICDNCGGKIIGVTGEVTTGTAGNVAASASFDADALLTDSDKSYVASGCDVEFILSVNDITSTVSNSDAALILTAAGENVIAVSYLDIDLTKNIYEANGGLYSTESVTGELNTSVTITVAIPETMQETVGSASGEYSVIRVHGGVADVLTTVQGSDIDTLTFTTDRFSTYGIVFTSSDDTEPTEPEPTEPEPTDPEVTEPEVTEPETTDPEATEPETTEPDTGDTGDTGADDEAKTGDNALVFLALALLCIALPVVKKFVF